MIKNFTCEYYVLREREKMLQYYFDKNYVIDFQNLQSDNLTKPTKFNILHNK